MSSNASFGARLRQHREAAALTQEELAARAGLTVKAVGAWSEASGSHATPTLGPQ